ncbi:MAG TPA: exo-beta-N-acetylmuramidase NamZ domain-containing protein, partial [Candidatus Limnocylindria bacterium]|nr:exo-beta-N-acetylmuramidase NamZ domain-containing protein [Candidatus Limnocylindria bacterium]
MTRVLAGIDNIQSADSLLRGRRLGLMTNQTGVDSALRPTIDILFEKYSLAALFACEHGVRGSVQAGEEVASAPDADTGVMVHSCYGASHHLPPEAMADFDVFVFDMQDVGARFYTYLYSLSFALEDCAREGKTAVVLDRPNPLGGEVAQGTL